MKTMDDNQTIPAPILQKKLRKLFDTCKDQAGQQGLVESAKKLYNKVDNADLFLQEFISVLKYVFVYSDKGAVDKMLVFVAKFAASLYHSLPIDDDSVEDDLENDHPFVNGLLKFLSQAHWASLVEARIRCVNLIKNILNALPEDSSVPIEMWNTLADTICTRLQDRSAQVRVAAVLVARKLQEPKDPKCPIMKLLLFHICDPAPAVRRAVLSSIAITSNTIAHVLARTLDVNENVRRNAFAVVSRIHYSKLGIANRVLFLERGLKDRSERVRACVENVMIEQWLDSLDQDVLKFIESLDAVNCPDVATSVANAILKNKPIEDVLKFLPIDSELKLIEEKLLTPEISLLWKCVAEYLHRNQREEELEAILPTLSTFCNYIEKMFPAVESFGKAPMTNEEQWTEVKKKRTLLHLLGLAKVFDFRDEMGRITLRKLIQGLLTNPRTTAQIVESLLDILHRIIPDQDDFISSTVEVISEIREPLTQQTQPSQQDTIQSQLKISEMRMKLNELKEKEYEAVQAKNYGLAAELKTEVENLSTLIEFETNKAPTQMTVLSEVREEKTDPETLCRCLNILIHLNKISGVSSLTTPLRCLRDDFVAQCLRSNDLLTQALAIQALAQFCLLDKTTAQDNLLSFLFMLSENGENELNLPALKAVFDIFQSYGIESFEKLDESRLEESSFNDPQGSSENVDDEFQFNENKDLEKSKSGAKFLSVLKELLNCSTNDELKKTAFEGFCKLLVSGIIYSPSLLRNIIIKGFTPIRGNESEDRIRQLFMVFFPLFARVTFRSQEMIQAAFIPVMRVLNYAQIGSPEADISAKDVAAFLIDHTKPGINSRTSGTVHVHDSLAIEICIEILRDASSSDDMGFEQIYLRSLMQLHLSFESESLKQHILTLLTKITKELSDSGSLRLLKQFQAKVIELSNVNTASIQNTLRTTQNSTSTRGSSQVIENSLSPDVSAAPKDTSERKSESLTEVPGISDESALNVSVSNDAQAGVVPETSESDASETEDGVNRCSPRKSQRI